VPPWVSLAVTVVFLAAGIAYSLWRTRGVVAEEPHGAQAVHRA
jgi:tellurite resistance protein TerC